MSYRNDLQPRTMDQFAETRAPTLTEVLRNQAPPPYTLSAFMAFLSQNHCLETLEFILDASRYQTCYYSLPQIPPVPGSDESHQLRTSWDRLINSYIRPGASREVNLAAADRESLLRIPNTYTPPSPNALDSAVYKITELMRESVLSPFLIACQQKLRAEQQQACFPSYDSFSYQRPQTSSITFGNSIPRPNSARPTSVPSGEFIYSDQNGSDDDAAMSGSDNPMTPPHTPPPALGTSPTLSNSSLNQWKKTKTLFQKMGSGRARSREP